MKQFALHAFVLFSLFIIGLCLALMGSALFPITDAEREAQTVSALYGKNVPFQEIKMTENVSRFGTAEKAYALEGGDLLILATGKGGYKDGTVSVWTVLACTGSLKDGTLELHGVKSVTPQSDLKQSFLVHVKKKFYREFTLHDKEVLAGKYFAAEAGPGEISNLSTGATLSSAAACNAVNAALVWFENYTGKNKPQKYAFGEFIDLAASAATVNGTAVSYRLSVKGNSPARAFVISVTVSDGAITQYTIETNGSTADKYAALMPQEVKDGSLFCNKTETQIRELLGENGALSPASGLLETGATRSTESAVRAAAFAVCNYALVLEEGGIS